jgi:hypothetical protein
VFALELKGRQEIHINERTRGAVHVSCIRVASCDEQQQHGFITGRSLELIIITGMTCSYRTSPSTNRTYSSSSLSQLVWGLGHQRCCVPRINTYHQGKSLRVIETGRAKRQNRKLRTTGCLLNINPGPAGPSERVKREQRELAEHTARDDWFTPSINQAHQLNSSRHKQSQTHILQLQEERERESKEEQLPA